MITGYELSSSDPLTKAIRALNIHTWAVLLAFIQRLPYGRNQNRTDFSLVISERKGTCSSKHALLKHVADLNNIPDVQLILGLYAMRQENTPGIGTILTENNMDVIPEAHCYLKINGQRVDITTQESQFQKIERDILLEQEILPEQVAEYKVAFHKDFLHAWMAENQIPLSFDKVWSIREQCIQNLSAEV